MKYRIYQDREQLPIAANVKLLVKVPLPEVKVAGQIDALKHFDVTSFVRMVNTNCFIRNVNQRRVLYFVDGVVPNDRHMMPLSQKNYVVPFQKSDKA